MAGGRPKAQIDYSLVEKLATIQCTDAEIAHSIGIVPETLCRRKKTDPELCQALEKGRSDGQKSLRRLQYQLALKGDKTMLIWLGKQYLEQSDKREEKVDLRQQITEWEVALDETEEEA